MEGRPSAAETQAHIDRLVAALKDVAPGALETYRDLALNLSVALHHRRPPDASCWHGLYVLLVLELDDDRLAEREAVKDLLIALDDYASARSPDLDDPAGERDGRLESTAEELRRAYRALGDRLVP